MQILLILRNNLLNAVLAKSIKYLVNHYLIFSTKKFIYDTAITVNYSVF